MFNTCYFLPFKGHLNLEIFILLLIKGYLTTMSEQKFRGLWYKIKEHLENKSKGKFLRSKLYINIYMFSSLLPA